MDDLKEVRPLTRDDRSLKGRIGLDARGNVYCGVVTAGKEAGDYTVTWKQIAEK
jgi:hypothetical protein